jgi:osmotically-inducible protein OsmY
MHGFAYHTAGFTLDTERFRRPEDIMKTNHQLQLDVIAELTWEPSVEASDIGVVTKDGVVTLTGHVRTFAEKVAAEKATERVEGVHAVANEVEVRIPSSARRDDADIARAALDNLKWNVSVPDDRIKLVVQDGWVRLDGEVDWQYQRTAAENAVRPLNGVRGVSNTIRIRPHVQTKDVRDAITAALKRSAEVEAQQIRVEAKDGKVTLRGRVHSWAERNAVEHAAWAAPGVTTVEDHLSVEGHTYV